MLNQNRPIGLGQSINDELTALNVSIDTHLHALNHEGVWLFLAALGCWSVPDGLPRLSALLASLVLFTLQYRGHGHDQRTIPNQFAASRSRVLVLRLTDEEKEEGIDQINRLEVQRMKGLRPFYHLPSFIVGWIAWGATLVDSIEHLSKRIA